MNEINILPPEIYNRLAAGEVVENPASIVKELVENSIDAGARKITVQIINGGIDEIIVTDDGEGVTEPNLPKVFLPHATSKIKTINDIDQIKSLGFRGEAMASIASVAKVEFTSKPKHQEYAATINERGELKRVGANNGTVVRVANLFYNTPARKKFLHSATVEKNNITAVIQHFIFANPDLHIRYFVDGKMIVDYSGNGLAMAMAQIFDIQPEQILEVNYQEPEFALRGFISNTNLSRPNKERQVMIVNGRVVNGGVPAAVINEVMANYLPTKEYPVFVLHLFVATDKVDVNVHPQKKEVRFEDKSKVTQFIQKALTQTLDCYFLNQINDLAKPQTEPTVSVDHQTTPVAAGKSFTPEQSQPATVVIKSLDLFDNKQLAVQSAPNILNEMEINVADVVEDQTTLLSNNQFTVLGQIFETYLLVRTPEHLLLIDQHAMAERMNYDKFRAQIDAGNVKSQILLAPIIVKLSPQELTRFEELQTLLAGFGFDCDLFGESAIRVSAIPAMMSNLKVNEFLSVILNDKEIVGSTLSEIIKHKVATMACKASLKAGEMLSNTQIEYFLSNYFTTKNVPLCPHGRPILLAFSKNKLESLFARR